MKTYDELTPLQQQVTARVEGLVEAMHDSTIAIPAPQAAFTELLRGRSCYDEQPSAGLNVARYTTAENISLPASLIGASFWTRCCLPLCTNISVTRWSGC